MIAPAMQSVKVGAAKAYGKATEWPIATSMGLFMAILGAWSWMSGNTPIEIIGSPTATYANAAEIKKMQTELELMATRQELERLQYAHRLLVGVMFDKSQFSVTQMFEMIDFSVRKDSQ